MSQIPSFFSFCSPLLLALAAALPAAELRNAPQNSWWVTDGPVHASAQQGDAIYLGGAFSKVGPFTGGLTALNLTVDSVLSAPLADVTWPTVNGEILAIISDGSGGWYIGGAFTKVGGMSNANVAHLLASGAVDTAFTGNLSYTCQSLALTAGKLYCGAGGSSIFIRNPATGAGSAYVSTSGYTNALVVAGAKIYAGTSAGVKRIDSATDSLDGFTVTTNSNVSALSVSGSTLYFGGSFTTVGTTARRGLAAVSTTDGSVSTWNPALNSGGSASALLLDGANLYVGGSFTAIGTVVQSNIARVDLTSGSADSVWTPAITGSVVALALDGGTLYLGGTITAAAGATRTGVATVSTASPTVAGYAPVLSDLGASWSSYPGLVYALAVTGSRLLVGGTQELGGGVVRNNAAAFSSSTGQATAWNPNCSNGSIYASTNTVRAIALNGTSVYLGGDFTQVAGVAHGRLAKVGSDGVVDAAFTASANATIYALSAASDGTLYAGGSFSTLAGGTRSTLGAVNSNGTLVSAFNPGTNGIVYSVLLDGSNLFLGGHFSQVGGTARKALAMVATADGSLQSWNPNNASTEYSAQVYTLLKQGGSIYFGGSFDKVGAFTRASIAAVDAGTGAITAWDPGSSYVNSITTAGSSFLVGGNFSAIGGANRNDLALIDSLSTATAWSPVTRNGSIQTVLALSDGRMLAGGSITPSYSTGFSRTGFAVYGPNTGPVASAGALTVLEDAATTTQALVGSDADADTLTWRVGAVNPAKGTVTVATNGTISYRPNANANGTDQFTVIANDGSLDSAPATITVTITPVNDSPVASGGSFSVAAGATATGTLNASDVDGNALTFSIVANPSSGSVTLNATTGAYSYMAPAGGSGSTSFTYKVNDGTVDSSVANVYITISGATGYPTVSLIEPISGATYLKGSTLQLSANAADSDGSIASVVFKQGTATLATDSTAPFQTTTVLSATGTVTFTAVATDNSGKSTTSTPISISVIDAPTVTLTSPSAGTSVAGPLDLVIAATATSGNPATVARVEFVIDGILQAYDTTAPYSVTVPGVLVGDHLIAARVIDSKGFTAVSTANITVTGTTDPGTSTGTGTGTGTEDSGSSGGGCGTGSGLAFICGALLMTLRAAWRRTSVS